MAHARIAKSVNDLEISRDLGGMKVRAPHHVTTLFSVEIKFVAGDHVVGCGYRHPDDCHRTLFVRILQRDKRTTALTRQRHPHHLKHQQYVNFFFSEHVIFFVTKYVISALINTPFSPQENQHVVSFFHVTKHVIFFTSLNTSSSFQ